MKGLLPGTFDPPTLGHLEIIQRAAKLCDFLYVAIGESSKSSSSFTIEQRRDLLAKLTEKISNVEIISFSGLVVACAKKVKADVIVRGLRSESDFNYEYQMAAANRQMSGIETLFLMASPAYSHLSSTIVREIAREGHRLQGLVPDDIESMVLAYLRH